MREEVRAATLTLEFIEKRRLSFSKAFRAACSRLGLREPGVRARAYELAYRALAVVYLSDYYFNSRGVRGLHLRRRCASRVAFRLVLDGAVAPSVLSSYTGGLLPRRVIDALRSLSPDALNEELGGLSLAKRLSLKYSHPEWLVEELLRLMEPREVEALLKANATPTRWIRVNTMKMDPDKGARKLEAQGLRLEPDRDFPNLFKVVEAKRPLDEVRGVREGYFIVQDKASVAVVHELDPSPGDVILDATAAPGLKAQLAAELSEGKAFIVAVDISPRRLGEMRALLKAYGAVEVEPVLADSAMAKYRRVDKVLIDPPCSNSGAIRRDPALRLVLRDREAIRGYSRLQLRLVRAVSSLDVADYVVFSTCSLLPEEGEALINGAVPEELVTPCRVRASTGYRGFRCSNLVARYFPHVHDTIGFFISRFEVS